MSIRLPAIERVPLGTDVHAAADALSSMGSRFTEGYLRADSTLGSAFLFVHQGSTHSAGAIEGDRFASASFGDFLFSIRSATEITLYRTDRITLFATAVLFHRAPSAQIPSHLLAGKETLSAIRQMGKDAVVVVRRDTARSLVFCHGGQPVVLYPAEGEVFPKGSVEDGIVDYVRSHPEATIDLYEDIHVPSAAGGGRPPADLLRDSSPSAPEPLPRLVVRLGERVVFVHKVSGDRLFIGRGTDNDIALENLSISRKHATLTRVGNKLVIEDLGSDNGLIVAGSRVPRADLSPGDVVSIGKYSLTYATREEEDLLPVPSRALRRPSPAPVTETVMVGMPTRTPAPSPPALEFEGRRYPLGKQGATIGCAPDASIQVHGLLVAAVHVQIVSDGYDRYRAIQIAAWRPMRVNGRITRQTLLRAGDVIEIAGSSLRFEAGPPSPGSG